MAEQPLKREQPDLRHDAGVAAFVAGGGPGTCTVMVVDDYAPLRALCTRLLERDGYQAVAAASADDAIELIARGVVPDVVVTDLNMPGEVTGADLIERLQIAHPEVGIVVITGMASVDLSPDRYVALLVKPFDNTDLLSTVARVAPR